MQEKGKNNGIQLFRAILFIGIVAFHCGVPLAQISWGGVEAFFVISSFFLTKKLLKCELDMGTVFGLATHRIRRLYPMYAVCLVCALALCVVASWIFPVKDLCLHMAFLQNFHWMATGYSSNLVGYTAHTWTMGIEVWLFLLWLFMFYFLRRGRNRQIFNILMLIVASLWRICTVWYIGDPMVTSLFPLAHADAFAVGSLMAMGRKDSKGKTGLFFAGCVVIGLVLVACSIGVTASVSGVRFAEAYFMYETSRNYLNNVFTCNIYFFISLLSAGLLYFFGKIHIGQDNVMGMFFVKLGNISYAGYLLHWPIRVVVVHFIDNVWLRMLCVLVLTIIACFVVQRIFGLLNFKVRQCKVG